MLFAILKPEVNEEESIMSSIVLMNDLGKVFLAFYPDLLTHIPTKSCYNTRYLFYQRYSNQLLWQLRFWLLSFCNQMGICRL